LWYRPPDPNEPCPTYVQLFRTGAIEAVDGRLVGVEDGKRKLLAIPGWERELIEKLGEYLSVQQELGLTPPIFVLLTLLGVKDYHVSHGAFRDTQAPIDRDVLLLPDLLVEDCSTSADTILRPAFDAVWQAAGWRCCQNYNKEGKWEDRSRNLR
jgi:hypothetical protein